MHFISMQIAASFICIATYGKTHQTIPILCEQESNTKEDEE